MPSYFYCPGEATVSTYSIQCSETLQTYQPPAEESVKLSELVAEAIYWGLLYWALFFVFSQIKKAIEAD